MTVARKLLIFTFCFLLLSISGCGYTTHSGYSKYKTIYIPPFKNKIDITNEGDINSKYKIYRPLLDSDVTKAVINKYLFDGNIKPVRSENADATLRGEILEFRKDPVRYDDNDNIEEYRVNLIVSLIFWDNKEDKLIWQEGVFVGDTTYFVVGATAKSEATAINEAIADLARRIVERTVEEW